MAMTKSGVFFICNRPPDKSAYWKIIFLITQPKHMLWVLKKPYRGDRSFEHLKHMFKLMGKEINAILVAQNIFFWTHDVNNNGWDKPIIIRKAQLLSSVNIDLMWYLLGYVAE